MKIMKNSDKLDKRQKKYLKEKFGIKSFKDLSPKILKNLKEAMKDLTDTRVKGRCSYKIWDVVVCVIISVLCGKKSWEEINDFVTIKIQFFKQFLKMTGGIPSAKTYERVMAIIDYHELEKILNLFFKTITINILNEIEILNFDGRESKGSKQNSTFKKEAISPLNMLNVYSNKYNMCIASEMIDEKTNEIPTVEKLIQTLNVKGAILTWDALNTQKSNIKMAVAKGADYVVPIKGNHPLFYQELKDFFDEKEQECIIAGKPNTEYKNYTTYKNGAIIKYEYFQTEEIDWYENKKEWEKLNSIGMVKKTITKEIVEKKEVKKEKTTIEYRYYISSLFIDIDLFEKAIEKHWSIENKLHWHLDYTFQQDKNNTLNKNALANLEIVNKFALSILKRVQKYYDKSLKRIIGDLGSDIDNQFMDLIMYLVLSDGLEDDENKT